jgi:hypothetical protein
MYIDTHIQTQDIEGAGVVKLKEQGQIGTVKLREQGQQQL